MNNLCAILFTICNYNKTVSFYDTVDNYSKNCKSHINGCLTTLKSAKITRKGSEFPFCVKAYDLFPYLKLQIDYTTGSRNYTDMHCHYITLKHDSNSQHTYPLYSYSIEVDDFYTASLEHEDFTSTTQEYNFQANGPLFIDGRAASTIDRNEALTSSFSLRGQLFVLAVNTLGLIFDLDVSDVIIPECVKDVANVLELVTCAYQEVAYNHRHLESDVDCDHSFEVSDDCGLEWKYPLADSYDYHFGIFQAINYIAECAHKMEGQPEGPTLSGYPVDNSETPE